jgi:DNA-binding MarR family transcriptional regulator
MGKIFNILRSVSFEDDDATLKNYHSAWRTYNKDTSEPFFAVFKQFEDKHLKDIEPGALKLYIYFGFHANNSNGSSWHSIQRIAEHFVVKTRTVDYWIEDLVKRDLIYRDKNGHKTVTTYLLPYSDTLMKAEPRKRHKNEDDKLLNDIVGVIKSAAHIVGNIKGIYHLFQWRTKKGVPTKTNNIQWLFIVTQRDNGVKVGHYYTLHSSTDYGVNKLDIDDPFIFDSNFKYEDSAITGIAIKHTPQIDEPKNRKDILEIIEDLSRLESADIENYPKLNYGKISDLLPDDEIEEDTEENLNKGGDSNG